MLLIILTLVHSISIEHFHTGMFEQNRDAGLYEVTIGVEDLDLILSGFGYFDSDKYCDMIMLSGSKDSLQVFLWKNKKLAFEPAQSLSAKINGTVLNVIPADLNYDGELDMLVSYVSSDITYMQAVLQIKESFVIKDPVIIPQGSQPVVMDLDGDLKVEILNNEGGEAKVFKYKDGFIEEKLLTDYGMNSTECMEYNDIVFAFPHTVGFVDLNKDCLADLFLTAVHDGKTYFEVWLNGKNGMYCKVQSELAPEGARQVSFADIDRNGVEDIIFAVCSGLNCKIKNELHIVYNFNEVSNDCSFEDISKSKFILHDLSSAINTSYKQIFTLPTPLYDNEMFPITVRLGDFNLDGFPDALVTLQNSTDASASSYLAYFVNVRCETCGKGERKLEKSDSSKFKELHSVPNAVFGCFFDLDDNGILDIIVVSLEEGAYRITSFYNNFLEDAFHLKTLALNGHSKGGYSSAYPGAVFMFTLTELDMSKVVMHSTQMPLTAFYALNTPYCVYGLGRTNSYIEEFFVALPLQNNSYKSWTPIIPNSYLIVSPTFSDSNDWFLELFASPTDKIGIIIGVCCSCMLLIGMIVVINYCREKREDKKLFGIKF